MSDRFLCHGLSLAATPVFAAMALATRGGDMPDMPGMASSPLSGMALMYLLMAVFHASPWLNLFIGRTPDLIKGCPTRKEAR